MPKYVLDEKGILTITSEHDGGLFTINDILKKITIILLVVSVVVSVGVYVFFYHDVTATNVATDYCASSIVDYNCATPFSKIINECDLVDNANIIFNKIDDYPMYYLESFEQMLARGQELVSEICYRIEQFGYRWR